MPGEVIVELGDIGSEMYFVIEGEIEISYFDERI